MAPFFDDVQKIVADLRSTPVDADELDRAKKPALEALEKRKQTNEFWLGQLSGAQADKRKLDAIHAPRRPAFSGSPAPTSRPWLASICATTRPSPPGHASLKTAGVPKSVTNVALAALAVVRGRWRSQRPGAPPR